MSLIFFVVVAQHRCADGLAGIGVPLLNGEWSRRSDASAIRAELGASKHVASARATDWFADRLPARGVPHPDGVTAAGDQAAAILTEADRLQEFCYLVVHRSPGLWRMSSPPEHPYRGGGRRSSSSASATPIDGSGPPRSRGAGAARSTSQMRTGALGFVRSVVVFLICGGFRPRAA